MPNTNLDANETIFFDRELENIKAKTYDIKYSNLQAIQLLPVSTEAGEETEVITYRQYDALGIAKIIANYSNDLPRVDVKAKEFSSKVKSFGNSYGYNIQEIRAAQKLGKNLESRRASVARKAHELLVDKIAWEGDQDHNLGGFLDNPNVPIYSAPPNQGAASTKWADKTVQEIITDIRNLINGVSNLTKGVEKPDTLLLPTDQYNLIASTTLSEHNAMTILEFIKKAFPFLKKIESVSKLKGAGTSGVDIMIAYENHNDKLTLEIPLPFEQLNAQEKGLEFIVNCHSRCGGVIIYYPLSVSIYEGI